MPVPAIPFQGLIIRSASYVFGSIMKKYYTKEPLAKPLEQRPAKFEWITLLLEA